MLSPCLLSPRWIYFFAKSLGYPISFLWFLLLICLCCLFVCFVYLFVCFSLFSVSYSSKIETSVTSNSHECPYVWSCPSACLTVPSTLHIPEAHHGGQGYLDKGIQYSCILHSHMIRLAIPLFPASGPTEIPPPVAIPLSHCVSCGLARLSLLHPHFFP